MRWLVSAAILVVVAGCASTSGVSASTSREQKDIENRVNQAALEKGNLPPGDGPSN